MSAIKPLQAVCSAPKCRRRQTVPANRIWYVDVRKGPGSHREAGWACRVCGAENTTPPAHLPKGTIALLPSRATVMENMRAETEARTRGATQRARDAVAAPTRSPDRTVAPEAPAATPAPTPSRQPEPTGATGPGHAETHEPVHADGPVWRTGGPAKEVLVEALRRISHHGGDAMAVANGRRGFEGEDVSLPDDDADEATIVHMADVVLRELDEMRADVLVLGGSVEGRPWQAVLHYSAGAASFT